MKNIYVSIDLKSFYASVECRERGLDPITTNLVVADGSRTEKTICLAVTPALKQYGIPGRARLFEVVQKVKEINIERINKILNKKFIGKSYDAKILKMHPEYKLDFIIAPPRMKYYMKYSLDIYNIYLKYFSANDILVYSIDEVFIDITHYIATYNMEPEELVTKIVQEIYKKTGITATAGMGTNLYLCKIAMDIMAKHVQPNSKDVRIAYLDEISYREKLWEHKPLTDFWRVGKGYAKKLEQNGIYTMGDVARCSIENEDKLFKMFGINAELLIDHAWGYEPCTIKSIKSYKPLRNSICSGQVLHCAYDYSKTKIIVKEMAELLTLDMVEKHVVTNQIVLTIGYDVENITNNKYKGEVTEDRYGRIIPKHAHGTINLDHYTSSSRIILEAITNLYERIINKELLVRRINIAVNNVVDEETSQTKFEQMNLFTNNNDTIKESKERELQRSIVDIKKKFGKNAILKGLNFEEGATTIERNGQVGGHKG